jgi:C-terminal processing protease CtpA/Prc
LSVAANPGEGYPGRIVLLTGPGTFSAAADFASSFDILNTDTILGKPPGGRTGQPLSIRLPGGGSARICTLQERYANGREFVGVGIQPKIPVRRAWPTSAPARILCWKPP